MGIQSFHSSSSLGFLARATTTILLLLSTTTQAIRPVGKVGKVATMAEWCNNTDNPDLCNSIMKNTKFGTCEQATRSAIRGTMVEINGGIAKIDTLVDTSEVQIKSLLEGCKEQYNFAIDDHNNALNQIQVESELMKSLSSMESYVQTCADGFSGFSDFSMTNPVVHVNGLPGSAEQRQLEDSSLLLTSKFIDNWTANDACTFLSGKHTEVV